MSKKLKIAFVKKKLQRSNIAAVPTVFPPVVVLEDSIRLLTKYSLLPFVWSRRLLRWDLDVGIKKYHKALVAVGGMWKLCNLFFVHTVQEHIRRCGRDHCPPGERTKQFRNSTPFFELLNVCLIHNIFDRNERLFLSFFQSYVTFKCLSLIRFVNDSGRGLYRSTQSDEFSEITVDSYCFTLTTIDKYN